MPFSWLTFAQAKSALSQRLYDTGTSRFWPDAELGALLIEALRTFNALGRVWRGDFTFPTQASITWYDLTDQTAMPATLLPRTVTDLTLLQSLCRALLEPAPATYPLSWTGSTQFSFTDLLPALSRRRDDLLGVTGCTLTRRVVPALPGRTFLPDTVLEVRRVAYSLATGLGGGIYPLWPTDTWELAAYSPDYTTRPAAVPSVYAMTTEPPLAFDVDTPPLPGSYELLTIEAGAALTTASSSQLSIPDDWTWALQWGALADLLSRDSVSRDPLRAAYSEQRYWHALSTLTSAPSLLALRLGNIPIPVDAVRGADTFDAGWQSRTATQPIMGLIAGYNLLALSPAPDTGGYSLTATVVQNAPVPSLDTDYVQVSRDSLESVLDYAQHIATFKQGGAEFQSTLPLLDRFLAHCRLTNSKLAEFSTAALTAPSYELSQRETDLHPRTVPEEAP